MKLVRHRHIEEEERHEFLVEARASLWQLDIEKKKDAALYERILVHPISLFPQPLWLDHPGWYRVASRWCNECGTHHALCAFCDEVARHFIFNEGDTCGHLCDVHVGPFLVNNEIANLDDSGEWKLVDKDGNVGPALPHAEYEETGAYSPVSECVCDGW